MMFKFRVWMGSNEEEKFINKFSRRGYFLASIAPFRLMPPLEFRIYKFKVAQEPQLIYKIDDRTFENKADKDNYLQLMEDDGWQFFEHNYTYNSWFQSYYWLKVRKTGDEEIYSDNESKLEAKNRACSRVLMFAIILLAFYATFPTGHSFQQNNGNIWLFILSNWYPFALLFVTITMLIGKMSIKILQRIHREV